MAVVQRTSTVLETLPRYGEARRQVRSVAVPVRRHVRVREPQLGQLLRRAALASIPAICITTAIYGRMQLLEATVQRSHLNAEMRQELAKQQMLHTEYLTSSRPEQIDRFAQANHLVMQVAAPVYVSGHQKGR